MNEKEAFDKFHELVVEISRKKIDQEDASMELKFMSSVIVAGDLLQIIRTKHLKQELNETQQSEIFNAIRQFIAAIDSILVLENVQQRVDNKEE